MNSCHSQQIQDAIDIWKAGVDGVDPLKLVLNSVLLHKIDHFYEIKVHSFLDEMNNRNNESNLDKNLLPVIKKTDDITEILSPEQRIIVVGMGKASAKMAQGIERALKPFVDSGRLSGWVNIPDDPLLLETPLRSIHLHGARPVQYNEPTEKGVYGSQKIIEFIQSAKNDDLIICLISGGGSALLPLPIPEISLQEKLEITRFLSAAGANIEELNIVRKELSQLKGGGIRTLCRKKRLISLILSDVLGDPLDIIASGPTVENSSTPFEALEILQKYNVPNEKNLSNIYSVIETKSQKDSTIHSSQPQNLKTNFSKNSFEKTVQNQENRSDYSRHYNIVIGNNQMAVYAAAQKAKELGYNPFFQSATNSEGSAEFVGQQLLENSIKLFGFNPLLDHSLFSKAANPPYNCFISGGEPIVQLVSKEKRGKGGRNQQLVLAALIELLKANSSNKKLLNSNSFDQNLLRCSETEDEKQLTANEFFQSKAFTQTCFNGIVPVFLSGGTDGEDGPTNAAGAFFDRKLFEKIQEIIDKTNLSPIDYLTNNNAWAFFQMFDALLKTGATGTNVCDLRIILNENCPSKHFS